MFTADEGGEPRDCTDSNMRNKAAKEKYAKISRCYSSATFRTQVGAPS